jgi:hypothetical protein
VTSPQFLLAFKGKTGTEFWARDGGKNSSSRASCPLPSEAGASEGSALDDNGKSQRKSLSNLAKV